MARGNTAKINVEKKIQQAFGNDFVGVYDKKLIVWANDGGERVQIAITMTCPKTNYAAAGSAPASGDFNFEDEMPQICAPTTTEPAELTPEETQRVEDLLAKLGL